MNRRSLAARAALSMLALSVVACAADNDADRPSMALTATSPPTGSDAAMPFVAADGERFYLSWTENTGEEGATGRSIHAVRMAWIDHGGEWSTPVTLASSDRFFVNWADFPSVASAGEGRLAAHWLLRSGEGTYDYDIMVSTSTDGGARWSEPRVMHDDGVAAEHGFLSFFPQEEGFGAVWLDGRETVGGHGGGGAMTLRGGLLTWDGTPRDLALLDPHICDCCQTGAALTDEGVVAVYRGRTEGEIRDILAVRMVNGEWSTPATIHDDGWEIPACPVNGPAVAADGRRVATAWFTGAGDIPRVRLAFSSDAGATWEAPLQVDEGAPLGRVDVVLLDDGSALVVWLEATDDDAAVMARRVRPDGSLDAAESLALTRQVRASGFPRMARSGERILLSWTEPAVEQGGAATLRAAWLDVGGAR
ncbi:MAG: exo-alpha-sialidase [Gemmatimonadales bacterium]|nr:MAG: exo-alpha-sialidase [Gemmatimonadales bacterium]